ncbi:hypothetical protein DYB26_002484 [Aphanomyces astaci]|nr:hypothetical protein DYB26_002484 [Aphanomyces astaci]
MAKQSPPPTVLRGWEWTQHALWREDVKCNVRMVDTVFFDPQTNRPSRWLFASKHGAISKKKDDHLALESIRDRFLRLSVHPRNPQKFVAHCLYRNGNRKLVNAAQFDDLISALGSPRGGAKPPCMLGLQSFVIPQGDPPLTLVATFKDGQCVVSAILQDSSDAIDNTVVSPRLRKEVEHATLEIVRFLQATAHQMLQQTQSLPTLKLTTDGGPKCRGDFCAVPVNALPGLFLLSPPTPALLDDTRERFKLGNHHILLGRMGMKYMQVRPSDDLATEWAAVDSSQRSELGRTNPGNFYKQVHVCANCNRTYTHIQALRETQFQHLNLDALDDDRHHDVVGGEQQRPSSTKKNSKAIAKKTKFKGGPPLLGPNNNFKPSDELMRFMGVPPQDTSPAAPSLDLVQDQQHEAEFLAELAKHSTPQTQLRHSSPPEAEDDSSMPLPAIIAKPSQRSSTKKAPSKRDKSEASNNNNQPVLAQFEHEWNQMDHANRSLMQENQALRDKLQQLDSQMVTDSRRWQQELNTALESNSVLEKQSKQVGKRMASMQKEFADAVAEKDELLRRQLVDAEHKFNQQLLERLATS